MIRYVGLDVHKREVEACLIDGEGAVVHRERFALTKQRLESFARKTLRPTDRVVVEATTNTWAVVAGLIPHVAEVAVSNPLQTKAIASAKIKTDKVDALVLAQLLRCDYLPEVWRPDEVTQELRRLTGRRAALVAERTRLKNRLHSVLAQRLMAPPVDDLFSTKGRAWLQECEIDEEGREMLDSDLRLMAAVEAEIAHFDKRLAEKGWSDARVKLLMTQPGVSIAVAQTVLAALGDVQRFRDGDHAAGYLGLVPSTKQSGDRCYHGPITKAGRGHARWMLIQAAQHVARHPGPLGVFFRRLKQKKNHNVAVVAVARKLVVIAWHMLTKNEPYRYAIPKSTQEKLRKLRVQATGERKKTGPRKGTAKSINYGTGCRTRTIPALETVYAEEGLPALPPLPPGEQRMLQRDKEVAQFTKEIVKVQIEPKNKGVRVTVPANG